MEVQPLGLRWVHKLLFCLAVALLASAVACCLLQESLRLGLLSLIQTQLALTPGSKMLHMWSNPPVDPVMRVYIYNFTNLPQYLAGESPAPEVSEVGPFTYGATHEKRVEGWDRDRGTVTFRTRSVMGPVTYPDSADDSAVGQIQMWRAFFNDFNVRHDWFGYFVY